MFWYDCICIIYVSLIVGLTSLFKLNWSIICHEPATIVFPLISWKIYIISVSVSLIMLFTVLPQKFVDEVGWYTVKVFGTVITIKRDVNGALLVRYILSSW